MQLFLTFPQLPLLAGTTIASGMKLQQHDWQKKIRKWWLEGRAKNKDLEYRFTGKESRLFCHNFMKLIHAIKFQGDDKRSSFKVHILAFTALNLRDTVSYFNRHLLTDEDLQSLQTSCTNFFRVYALYLAAKPTTWTIGHVVPAHTRQLHESLGVHENRQD